MPGSDRGTRAATEEALRTAITDPRLRTCPLTGAIDQFTDSTDAADSLPFLRACTRAATALSPILCVWRAMNAE